MPAAGLDVASKVLARPATVWLALASLNAPPVAMSAKVQSPPGAADGAGWGGLGCARGAAAGAAGGWARGAATGAAGGWERGAAAIAGAAPRRRLCASERRPSVSLTRRTSVRTGLTLETASTRTK